MEASREAVYSLLGDQPYRGEADPLQFDQLVEQLVALLVQSRSASPFTLGIESAWGTGKSTLMMRMQDRLDRIDGISAANFNAWAVDEEVMVEAFVKTVLVQLDGKVLREAARKERLGTWIEVPIMIAAGLLGVSAVVDRIWSRVARNPADRNDLKPLIEKAVDGWRKKETGDGDQRLLVVFVDDLDRCSPKAVLDLLEAMKVYLDVPGLVFVVGYDQNVVSRAVLDHKEFDRTVSPRDYLEKFVQMAFEIPRPTPQRGTALIEELLDESGIADLLDGAGRDLVLEGSDWNPRRVKRFLNRFVLAYSLDPVWRRFSATASVKFQLIQMSFPSFAKLLARRSADDPIEEFLDYVEARRTLVGQLAAARSSAVVVRTLDREGLGGKGDFGDNAAVRTLIEDNAPVEFREFADEPSLAPILQSLREEPDWTDLHRALVSGVLKTPATKDLDGVPSRGGHLPGLRVLWVDDDMSGNQAYLRQLLRAGAQVEVADDTAGMTVNLGLNRGAVDVLISDVTRGKDQEAGFEAVADLSEEDRPDDVIFFAARATAARLRRARELDAVLITDPRKLFDRLEAIAERLYPERFLEEE
jgi:CheY-like chemotaxis protein